MNASHDDSGREARPRPRHDGVRVVHRRDLVGAAERLQNLDQPVLGQLAARLRALEDVPADFLEGFVDFLRRELPQTPSELRKIGIDPVLQLLGRHHFSFCSMSGAMSAPIEATKPEA